jgi:hypothetical protein
MITRGWVTGHDGLHHPASDNDRLSVPGNAHTYRLTDRGAAELADWGLSVSRLKFIS